MKEKTLTIQIPDGYDDAELIDNKVVFKKKEDTPWRQQERLMSGCWIGRYSDICEETDLSSNSPSNRNIFATKKQAKSALAMAQLSQIIANDVRFGGPITDREWEDNDIDKYVIKRRSNCISKDIYWNTWFFLAFHTSKQRNLFLEENEDLINEYFMIDNE